LTNASSLWNPIPPLDPLYFTTSETDFTNLVSPVHLQELAEADALKELVQEVQVLTRVMEF
jgi:hypothetical protein